MTTLSGSEPPKEAPQLRPLGVGDIVDRVFALYRARPGLFLAIAAVPYLVLVLVIAALTIAFAASMVGFSSILRDVSVGGSPDPALLASGLVGLGVLALIVIVFAIVVLSAQSAALIDGMSEGYLGRRITLGQAFRDGFRAAPSVIGAGLLVFVILLVGWGVLIAIMAVSQQALVILLAVLGGLVATIYFASATLVAPVVATIEHVGPIAALQRSWALSTGNRWRIIGIQLLLVILNAVISALLSAVFVTTLFGDTTTRTIFQQIANLIASVAWAPVQWGTFAILYYDLRVRREAFDLTFAAEALPRQP